MRARPNIAKLLRSFGLSAATDVRQSISTASAAHSSIFAPRTPLSQLGFFKERTKDLAQQLLSRQLSSLIDEGQHITHRKD